MSNEKVLTVVDKGWLRSIMLNAINNVTGEGYSESELATVDLCAYAIHNALPPDQSARIAELEKLNQELQAQYVRDDYRISQAHETCRAQFARITELENENRKLKEGTFSRVSLLETVKTELDCYKKLLKGLEEQRDILIKQLEMLIKEERPAYHDCLDNGLPECEWCLSEKTITKIKEWNHE